jgi:hypothetical protein
VKSSPPWDPLALLDADYAMQLHRHYGWPEYLRWSHISLTGTAT